MRDGGTQFFLSVRYVARGRRAGATIAASGGRLLALKGDFMSTTTTPKVDVGALAGFAKVEAADRVAEALTGAFSACDDRGHPVAEVQQAEMISHALTVFDGFEATVLRELVRDLTLHGVDVWGWAEKHETTAEQARQDA